ncbi:hypothetical protein BH10ACI3_BH10ACI3_20160 [soil metagenome]
MINTATRFILLTIFVSAASLAAAQTAAPTATPTTDQLAAEEARIRAEIKLMDARQEYLNKVRAASGNSNITAENSGGKTSFTNQELPNLESISLSYDAVKEISSMIDGDLKPSVSQYRRLIIYYEPDFLSLIKYRVYREQVRLALVNYDTLVAKINEEKAKQIRLASNGDKQVRSLGADVLTGLNAPSMAIAAIKSVAELASLFRTDTSIYESRDIVDNRAMGAVVAGTFLRANPGLIVYHPEQFAPEYNIDPNDATSIYAQSLRISAATAYIEYFLAETGKLPVPEQNAEPLSNLIAGAKLVQSQLKNLGFSNEQTTDPDPARGGSSALRGVSEFRQMIRAEKLDRMLSPVSPSGAPLNEKVGIVKVRLLSSGGSRRETRNLIFGSKTAFSGSAVIEIALYDADGTMRASKVFSYQTGFRKLKPGEAPKQ